jgi:hypothetical protein
MRDVLKRLEAIERAGQPKEPPNVGFCLAPLGEEWTPERASRRGWLDATAEVDGEASIARAAGESGEAFRARAAAHFTTGPYFVS